MYKYKLVKERTFTQPQDAKVYQEERIAAFDKITQRLNSLYPAIDNAKDETIAYYNEKPESYAVVKPTDLILSYLDDIEELLKKEE
jgi:hypothetical protein